MSYRPGCVATPPGWIDLPVEQWRAVTVMGPWDFAIGAPYAQEPIQPWAFPVPPAGLDLSSAKDVENRPWYTNWRGPLIIHSGRGWDRLGEQFPLVLALWQAICPRIPLHRDARAWIGRVTSIAYLVDCHPAEPGCCTSPWGHYGRFNHHLVLDDVHAVPDPPETRGFQRLWRPPATLIESVRASVQDRRRR